MGGTAQPLTSQPPPPAQGGFDPLNELRTRYPGVANEPDEKVYKHLSDPNNFRAAFPEYAHLDDDTITRNMASHAPSEQARQGVVTPGIAPMKAQNETQFEKDRNPANQSGFLSNFWDSLKSFVPQAHSPYPGMETQQKSDAATEAGQTARDNQAHRVEQGRSLPYRAIAPVGEMMGADVRGMEDAADVGNRNAILGKAAAPIAVAAAPLAAEGAERVAKPIGRATGIVARPITNAAKATAEGFTVGMPGEAMVKKGLSPYAKQTGYDAAIETAKQDIVNYHKDSPIKTVKDLDEAIPEIQKKIQNEEIRPAVARHADEPLAPERMARVQKAVEDSVSPFAKEFDEAGAKNVADLAEKMGKTRTVGEALGGGRGGLLGYINGQLESYFSKYPSARRSDLMNNPDTAGWAAARRALRDEVLDHLKEAGEPNMGEARARWGALEELSKTTERRINQADRVKPMTLPRILGLVGAGPTAGLSMIAGEVAHHLNKTDVLLRRGIDKMAKDAPAARPINVTPIRQLPPEKPPTPSAPPNGFKGGINTQGATASTSAMSTPRSIQSLSSEIDDTMKGKLRNAGAAPVAEKNALGKQIEDYQGRLDDLRGQPESTSTKGTPPAVPLKYRTEVTGTVTDESKLGPRGTSGVRTTPKGLLEAPPEPKPAKPFTPSPKGSIHAPKQLDDLSWATKAKETELSDFKPEELEDAKLLVRQTIDVMKSSDKPGRYFIENQPGDFTSQRQQNSAKGIHSGGYWMGIKSGRTMMGWLDRLAITPSQMELALSRGEDSPVYQRMMKAAASYVRAEKNKKTAVPLSSQSKPQSAE